MNMYILQPLIDIRLSTYLPVINYQAKTKKVWALPLSLAATYGIIGYFLFLALLRCFSSGGYRYLPYIFR